MSPNSSKTRLDQTSPAPEVDQSTKVESKEAVQDAVPVESEVKVNGTSIAREKQEASYVGWKQVGGWEEKDQLTHQDLLVDFNKDTFLGNLLPDKLYGDWYHNVAILAIGALCSFVLGYFRFSFASVFIVMTATGFLYRTSSKKYRGSLRDLAQKEQTVEKISDDYESVEWLNTFLDKFWPVIEPSVSQQVVDGTNTALSQNEAIPKFIKAIWLDQFTLGVKPPRVDAMKTFQNTKSDVVVTDLCLSFTPHDMSDLDAKQCRNYVNSNVVLKAKMFGVDIPFSVSDISFQVFARFRFQLMTTLPLVETINIQLLEVPEIDFIGRLLGNSIFNWEILAIPGLMRLIQKMALKYLSPVLLPPFSLQLNIPQLLSKTGLPIGVLEIKVKNAHGLIGLVDMVKKTVDPYLTFELSGKTVGKTKIVKDSRNPVWNESIYILLDSFTDPLTITVYDKRGSLNDKKMGTIIFNLNKLHANHHQKNEKVHFLRNSKPVGHLTFDLQFSPTIEPKKLLNGDEDPLPDMNTGITKIIINEFKGSDEPNDKNSVFAELYVNAELVMTTKKEKGATNIEWNSSYLSVITDRRKTICRFVIKDQSGKIISSSIQPLNYLIDRTEVDKKWIPLKDGKGELKVTTYWRPVAIDLGLKSVGYTSPIGMLRVFINKAENLRNPDNLGKISPYATVSVNSITRGRTNQRIETLDPIWNQSVYVSVTSPLQKVSINCVGTDTNGSDHSLGSFNIQTQNIYHKDNDDKYTTFIDDTPRTGNLVGKKGVKGTVTYYLSFYPVVPVLSLEETKEVDEINEKKDELERQKAQIDDKSISKKEKERMEKEQTRLTEKYDMYSYKMKLDLDELLQYNAGVLGVTILGGELPQPGLYVQTFFDSCGYAVITSAKNAIRIIKTGWSGDFMIKELEWSVTTFRVTKTKDANKADDFICEVDIPTIELVKNCYKKPSVLNLMGKKSAKLLVQVSWFPINVSELPQSDLITNSGDLKITAKSAENLIGVNRNGYSDPYLEFCLNEMSSSPVFKTAVQKKTLNPSWNESKTIEISNRVNDYLTINVKDYESTNSNRSIGKAIVPLSTIRPEDESTYDIPVVGPKGEDGGVLHLEFEFEPRYTPNVVKREAKFGNFATKGLGTGIKAGSTVLTLGTNVVSTGFGTIDKVKTGIFGGGKKRTQTEDENSKEKK
ncbi:tcb2p [Saccharomyces arboricola H-6]|uniref:Tcb2p n=1 Tax=Saccharomyces arboricola (strain H-6 / AS 2.3317 / CBS 10644) TaxID=1160507 RepID=J8PII5_SACAR|nr:tcb2p [Saccharomyces arboricola H-6]